MIGDASARRYMPSPAAIGVFVDLLQLAEALAAVGPLLRPAPRPRPAEDRLHVLRVEAAVKPASQVRAPLHDIEIKPHV